MATDVTKRFKFAAMSEYRQLKRTPVCCFLVLSSYHFNEYVKDVALSAEPFALAVSGNRAATSACGDCKEKTQRCAADCSFGMSLALGRWKR
jgi:hypothetical protein